MTTILEQFDMSEAVDYHYGQFPPEELEYERLLIPLSDASAALARYDAMLRKMHSHNLFLAPLQRQEAVVSSRIEGTITTLDDVLEYELGEQHDTPSATRNQTMEVHSYRWALQKMQESVEDGHRVSNTLLCNAHKELLRRMRGADKVPGTYKTDQNYLADNHKQKILFIPIKPHHLQSGMDALFAFIDDADQEILLRTALAHVEFESLHPFSDGNGRIGRMLFPLMLWKYGAISHPHFYVSQFFEKHKDEYIDRMRAVSRDKAWTDWCLFFLRAIKEQSAENIQTAEKIENLYDNMNERFKDALSTKWFKDVLDFMMERPIFWTKELAERNNIGQPNATRFVKILVEKGYITKIRPPAGRRAAIYRFDGLLNIIRG